MRLTASCLTAVAALTLSAACGETRSPTAVAAQSARLDVTATSTTSECVARIDALIVRTSDAVATPITGKNAETKDRPGLIEKLTAARTDLGAGKPADAVLKLQNYIAKVQQLSDAGKLAPDVAASLIADAQSAITCIQPQAV